MNLIKIVKFDFINTIKNPVLIFSETVLPITLFLVFGFIMRNRYGAYNMSSYDYYGVTMIIFSTFLMSIITANIFMERKIQEGNIRIIYSPTAKINIYLSKILTGFLFGTIVYTILMVLEKYVLGINYGDAYFGILLLIIIIFNLFTCCIGGFACCLLRSEEAVSKIIAPINYLLAMLGGLFTPVGGFGSVINKISYISPVRWVSDCMFKIIYDNDLSMAVPLLGVLIVLSLILIGLCQISFKPEEYV